MINKYKTKTARDGPSTGPPWWTWGATSRVRDRLTNWSKSEDFFVTPKVTKSYNSLFLRPYFSFAQKGGARQSRPRKFFGSDVKWQGIFWVELS